MHIEEITQARSKVWQRVISGARRAETPNKESASWSGEQMWEEIKKVRIIDQKTLLFTTIKTTQIIMEIEASYTLLGNV